MPSKDINNFNILNVFKFIDNRSKIRPQNRPEGYDVKSWIFLPQHGNGYSVVDADSLETIWKQWSPWRELLEFTIEPCADLDQTVALYC